jgi:hypothetical protein
VGMRRYFALGVAAVVWVGLGNAVAAEEAVGERERQKATSPTSVFAYLGQFSATRFNRNIRFDTDFQSSWVGVLGINRELTEFGHSARLEGEVNFAQHGGMQHHQEANLALIARWTRFPWDGFFDTSVAFGSGLSFASQPPPIEETPEQPADRFLLYMVTDIEGARPSWGDWSVFVRIHHRSGVFGLISDARGSNFVGLGMRRRY